MYKVTKIGLLNFWYYDEEEYEFYDGKLLLRGENASGKSVTMQSFIPLILDGNKSPKRLDTFGGSDKHIEYYLLGDDKESSIGYLYMEFYNNIEDKYITIGIGLNAKRGKQTDFWGFSLKDGTRIHNPFELYKANDGFHKTPLTKNELKARLGINNDFVEKAKDYKKMVNNLLFGFKNIESYDEFINILLQIRSPKLSKEFKPSILIETLNSVLPPLSDDDLRPLSETIESLNSTKEKMEELGIKMKDLTNFIKIYNNYNETILYGKAKKYVEKKNEYENLVKEEKETAKNVEQLKEKIQLKSTELDHLKFNYEKAMHEKENIDNKDVIAKTEKLAKLELDINDLNNRIKEYVTRLEDSDEKLKDLHKKKDQLESDLYNLEKDIAYVITDLEELSDTIYFDHFKNYLDLIMKNKELNTSMMFEMLKNRKREIEEIKNKLEEKKQLNEKIEEETKNEEVLTKEYNHLLESLDHLSLEIEKLKENFINTIFANNKKHQELILSELDLKEIIGSINEFNLKTIHVAKNKWDSIAKVFHEKKLEERASLNAKLLTFNKELEAEEQKLEELKNESEAELPENALELDSIAYLEKNSIHYLSFYKAIEFDANLSKETCDKLEANLLASGLLQAKIIDIQDKDKLKHTNISYIIPSKEKKENLSKFLNVSNRVKEFTKQYIEKILKSISISANDEVYLNEQSYQFDFLNGNMKDYESKYIGFLNRQKEHERKCKEQEENIHMIKQKMSSVSSLIDTINNKINILLMEQNHFPSTEDLENKTRELDLLNINIEVKMKEKNKSTNHLSHLNQALQELIKEVNKLKRDSKIPLNLVSYQNAITTISALENKMHELENLLNKARSLNDLMMSNNSYLEDVVNTHDHLFGEISINKDKVKVLETEKSAIEEILNTKEYQELQIKLKEIENIINSFAIKNDSLVKNIGSMEKEVESLELTLQNLTNKLKKDSLKLDIYYTILEEEVNLKYILPEFILTKENAKTIIKTLENNEGRDKITAIQNYYRGFNTYRQSLMDYGITDTMIFNEKDANIQLYVDKGLEKEELASIYSERSRQDLSAIYQSKKVNLYTLLTNIKNDYEESKIYLSESDRHLFEDILLRTIGAKIKDKINNAKDWVNNINDIMAEKQKNSNLSFHLAWNSLSPESLEEMDTKELVEIFKMDPDTLTKETINKLIKHFRAKISKAEETMNDNKESYFDIIFNILDYRNWFKFKLFYRRNNSDKKELTDKIFSVFSGGEKAKTMYVPLFASISAKISDASLNAPRLIALDEAFAGVDDRNIEEMFAILKSFDLDYILTSQALWCDYSEIKDISICELISDHVSKTIGVKRYRWNGIVRIPLDGE